eukprot:CAMPEP_0175793828 /NCGR_PEP_ID=MMETSP0097-20121207/83663_1 /TAXON_ID=311494 /ORGANISM="Alexandrium monilatum, Strain CCMP3105" /LENGTH=548 /DNA_ID=CAMNT_0017105019 /DNA_START=160 /DNA_END=1803 /DNA_ORIENTATION=+
MAAEGPRRARLSLPTLRVPFGKALQGFLGHGPRPTTAESMHAAKQQALTKETSATDVCTEAQHTTARAQEGGGLHGVLGYDSCCAGSSTSQPGPGPSVGGRRSGHLWWTQAERALAAAAQTPCSSRHARPEGSPGRSPPRAGPHAAPRRVAPVCGRRRVGPSRRGGSAQLRAHPNVVVEAVQSRELLIVALVCQLLLHALHRGRLPSPLRDGVLYPLLVCADRLHATRVEPLADLDPGLELHGLRVELHKLHLLLLSNTQDLLALEAHAIEQDVYLCAAVLLLGGVACQVARRTGCAPVEGPRKLARLSGTRLGSTAGRVSKGPRVPELSRRHAAPRGAAVRAGAASEGRAGGALRLRIQRPLQVAENAVGGRATDGLLLVLPQLKQNLHRPLHRRLGVPLREELRGLAVLDEVRQAPDDLPLQQERRNLQHVEQGEEPAGVQEAHLVLPRADDGAPHAVDDAERVEEVVVGGLVGAVGYLLLEGLDAVLLPELPAVVGVVAAEPGQHRGTQLPAAHEVVPVAEELYEQSDAAQPPQLLREAGARAHR